MKHRNVGAGGQAGQQGPPPLWYRRHEIADWRQQVRDADLNPIEEWALMRLYDHQWQHGRIPASPQDVRGLLVAEGLTDEWTTKGRLRLPRLLDRFFPVGRDGWRQNPGLAEQWAEARSKQLGNQRAAFERWAKEKDANAAANADANA